MNKLLPLLITALISLSLLASSCRPFRELRKTPAEKLAALIDQHPELSAPETVRVAVPVVVPEVRFEKVLVPATDTLQQARERAQLDSLLSHLQATLDTTQARAVRARLEQLLLSRPVLRDTLCFDTLGIRGRIWLQGRNYTLQIVRAAIRDTARGSAVVGKLAPCPPPLESAPLPWYNPAGWGLPWWLWLLIGLSCGVWLGCLVCIKLLRRSA